jgi:hypothetical protein
MKEQTSKRFCHADSDGDCEWEHCPQRRDNEPKQTGRSCSLSNPPGPFGGYYDED